MRIFAAIVCLWLGCQPWLARACRYNVRDLGFIEHGTEAYTFYAFVRGDTPAEVRRQLTQLPSAILSDSNIQLEVVDLEKQPEHAARKHLPRETAPVYPTGVLVSAEGRALPVSLVQAGQPFAQSLLKTLEGLVSSAKRQEIGQKASQTFGVILLLEGTDTQQNDKARQAALKAIEQITGEMKTMPKAIAQPPVLVALAPKSFVQEKVLLWSLGLTTEATNQARAAVIYGKSRWVGPLMRGEEIRESNLAGVLAFIGADCECGMDLTWTRGTRLPARWDDDLHAQATKSLGFDPENPMVKMEAGRILGRSVASGSDPLRYEEVTLPDLPAATPEPATIPTAPPALPPRPHAPTPAPPPVVAQSQTVLKPAWYAIGGLAAITGLAALLIVRRKRG